MIEELEYNFQKPSLSVVEITETKRYLKNVGGESVKWFPR